MIKFVAPRVPFVDPATGIISRPWFLLLEQLFSMGGIDNDMADLVGPADISNDAILAQFATMASEAAQSPLPPQPMAYAPDDVLPALGALRDEVAALRSRIDDMQKGTVTL